MLQKWVPQALKLYLAGICGTQFFLRLRPKNFQMWMWAILIQRRIQSGLQESENVFWKIVYLGKKKLFTLNIQQ